MHMACPSLGVTVRVVAFISTENRVRVAIIVPRANCICPPFKMGTYPSSNARGEVNNDARLAHRAGARCRGRPLRMLDAIKRALSKASLSDWTALSANSAISSRRAREPLAQR